jgi:predicted AAA+ superfamily ATPase
MINNGYLPIIYFSKDPEKRLNSYVSLYLKEEIAAEGLVRRLPSYSQFLSIAALSDGEVVNYTNIARETGVSSETVRGYFEILEDTLLGRFLPSYKRRPKRRIVKAPKFYFSDVGIVNFLAKRKEIKPGSELFGKAFENWLFHELHAYNTYKERFADLSYWRLSGGIEVDFIINHIDCAIECKGSAKIHNQHLKGLRQLKSEYPNAKRLILVSPDEKNRKTDDGIEVLWYREFLSQLWSGKIF